MTERKTPKTIMYVNLDCSSCQKALSAAENEGIAACQVEYLKNPLDHATLRDLSTKLGMRPKDFIRTKEKIFDSLDLDLENDSQVIDAMVLNPILIQRPIVVAGDRAFIGRTPESIQEFLEAAKKIK